MLHSATHPPHTWSTNLAFLNLVHHNFSSSGQDLPALDPPGPCFNDVSTWSNILQGNFKMCWQFWLQKANMCNLVTFLFLDTSMWVVCGWVWFQERIPKWHVLKRDWTTCSKYDNHFRFNNQHVWRGLYDHLMNENGNLHFDVYE